MIEIKNLTIGYKNKKVLENLNMTFCKNQLSFILGLNGTGKTTLLKSLLKMIPILKGEIKIEGQTIENINQKEMAKHIAAVLPLNFSLPEIKVTEFLNLYNNVDETIINEVLQNFELTFLKHHYITQVSQGQLQQLFIIRALLQNTPYIILDEPTAHLDYINKPKVFQILKNIKKEKGRGVIIITHELEYAKQLSDQLIELK